MIAFLKKQYLTLLVSLFIGIQAGYGQGQLVPLGSNDVIKRAYRQLSKKEKANQFIYYESIVLPVNGLFDDFSNYTGYPDTALWIGRQTYVNQSFSVRPPTIGCVTLDAVDERGFIYAHATTTPFSADTLLSKPIRLDSIFTPYGPLKPIDSIYLSFYYQPGGGEKKEPWNKLGDDPETDDSLVLEFGYQTGNIELLYYITTMEMVADSLVPGDTLYSGCDSSLYIIVQDFYYPGDTLEMPCDSVNTMEVVWEKVWSDEGRTLEEFMQIYGNTFHQVMIPITDLKYFNRGFQFRFRNYASLELDNNSPAWGSNVDFWNIDYVRLNRGRSYSDTIIDDIAFVNNPGGLLKNYTAMPWNQFKDNQTAELRTDFTNYLTNLFNDVKNSYYGYEIFDENKNVISSYDGGAQNINPFFLSGYQTAIVHANPGLTPISFLATSSDSVTVLVQHIFRETGLGDRNSKNDTAKYTQMFHNYYAYDDGTPEAGYIVVNSYNPYKKSLALGFMLNKPDTLRAIDIYFNHTFNNASFFDFTLSIWEDNNGKPGNELYTEEVSQEFSLDLYGFQRFYLEEPLTVSGKFYIGYQISGLNNVLNLGFDQNTDARQYVFERVSTSWDSCLIMGSPMMRPILGAWFPPTEITEHTADFDVKIYPNPNNGQLTINSEQLIMNNAELFDVYGRKLSTFNLQLSTNRIDISHLQTGIYFLKIQTNEGMITKKIVKQ